MSGPHLVEVRGLEVRYGDAIAVRGVDVTVQHGEVLGFIGPDGAGKTSTLRVIGGLLRASAGEVRAFSAPVWSSRRTLHQRLGYLAQRFALYGDLTVDENIQFFALMYGVRGWRQRRDALLRRVDLERFRDRQADRLSGGMKQKLALACTLIHSPELLLLDEPTTGVDPVTRRELWRLLGDLVAEGLTLVVATPYLDEAERCSRIVLLHQGAVLADAPPHLVTARLPGRVVEVAASPRREAAAALKATEGLADLQIFGDRFHVRTHGVADPTAAVRSALASARIEPVEIREIPAGLEDTFLYLTQSADTPRGEEAR